MVSAMALINLYIRYETHNAMVRLHPTPQSRFALDRGDAARLVQSFRPASMRPYRLMCPYTIIPHRWVGGRWVPGGGTE